MADVEWVGRAADIAEIKTVLFENTYAEDDTVTIRSHDAEGVITVGTSVGLDDVADMFVAFINGTAVENESRTTDGTKLPGLTGNGQPGDENRVTAEKSSSTTGLVYVTGRKGHPFNLEVSVTTAGDGSVTLTEDGSGESQLATGKHFLDDVDNWSTGAAPGAGDVAVCRYGSGDILYNLGSIDDLEGITVYPTYTGKIGLADVVNDNPQMPYNTVFATHVSNDGTQAIELILMPGVGKGSSRIRIDQSSFGGVGADGIHKLNHRAEREHPDLPVVDIINCGSDEFLITACDCRAVYAVVSSTSALNVYISTPNKQESDAYLEIEGTNADIDNVIQNGGTLKLIDVGGFPNTAMTIHSGRMILEGVTDPNAFVVAGGVVEDNGDGAYTGTTVIRNSGELTTKRNYWFSANKTMSECQIHGPNAVLDDSLGLFATLAVEFWHGATAAQWLHPTHKTLTLSAIS